MHISTPLYKNGPGPFTALASMHKSLDTVTTCRHVQGG
ncbi:unnamed protein product [Penicillium roqueforti FM164]|uniref:Genomic scaffold, ProqFM164S01 n=1 Tax=Penicillium roqueforti (strain FM164) TaxID=1365484 RepID=W6PVQ0_PENRF|nr:unnamed protein product [Penicillium roqueforti FM164]